MGQIAGKNDFLSRVNLKDIGTIGVVPAGEHILVSSDNSMNANGQGNFDCYIVGDGSTAASALEVKYIEQEAVDIAKEVSTYELKRIDANDIQNTYIAANGGILAASSVKTYHFDNSNERIKHVYAVLASVATNHKFVGFYNSLTPSSSSLISGVTTEASNEYVLNVDVPSGCKLIVVANNHTIIQDPEISLTYISEQYEKVSKIDTLEQYMESTKDVEDISCTSGYFINSSGYLAQSSSYDCTCELVDGSYVVKYIKVNKGDIIHYNGEARDAAKAVVGYNASKRIPTILLENTRAGVKQTVVVPIGISYVAFSCRNTSPYSISIERGYIFAKKEDINGVEKLLDYNVTERDADKVTGNYVNGSGDIFAVASYNAYWFYNTNGQFKTIEATLANNSTNKFFVAFYNSEEPSSSTFIFGVTSSVSDSYTINKTVVPQGCKLIIVFNLYGSLLVPTININTKGTTTIMEETISSIEKVKKAGFITLSKNYIVTNNEIGTVVDTTEVASTILHCITPVKKGDVFKIKGRGADAPRLWAFTDESYILLSNAKTGLYAETEIELTASQDGFFIYNTYPHFEHYVYALQDSGNTIQEVIPELVNKVEELEDSTKVEIEDEIDFDFNLNGKYDSYTRPESWDASCSALIERWDSMVDNTIGWTKNDTVVDTGLTTPSEQPCPIYIYKHLAKKSRIDNSKHLKVLIYCGEHANEVEGHYVLLDVMRHITTNWATDHNSELACSLVDFYVMPCINPWGFKSSRLNYNGVNINRNYASSDWKLKPEGSDYGGPSPASEFETQTVQWYIDNIKPHIMISVHTGGTNSYGAIGTLEYSIDDLHRNYMSCVNWATTTVRMSSNMLIKSNTNYAQDLSTCIIDANLYKRSDIDARAASSSSDFPYTGLCHFYAVEHGVIFPMLIELNTGSDWSNGVYTQGVQEKSDITYRGNMIHLSNVLFRSMKNVYKAIE